MPATAAREDQQRAQIFSALFWVGVGLAPLAALVLLIGSSTGSLRTAVGILVISVIMIAVSIMLRRESETMKSELEETLFDEIDTTRADVRDEIGHAVQQTHRAFGEKFQYLVDQLEGTRAELEATRGQLEMLRHQLPTVVAANGRPGPPGPSAQQPGHRAGMPSGIVRHTETVQVTTRHTVMDPNEEGRGTTYGRPPQAVPRSHSADSWTEQRLRDQLDRRHEVVESSAVDRWQQRGEPHEQQWSAPIEDDDRRPGLRAGDRWASIRDDDHGRELRMGERRAALHSDGAGGTELRIEDRWAAVRREAGLDRDDRPARGRGGWNDDDQRDVPRADFPYRERDRDDRSRDRDDRSRDRDHDDRGRRAAGSDRDRDDRGRRAITGSDREERWSTYDDRDRDRDYRDRDYERRYRD